MAKDTKGHGSMARVSTSKPIEYTVEAVGAGGKKTTIASGTSTAGLRQKIESVYAGGGSGTRWPVHEHPDASDMKR